MITPRERYQNDPQFRYLVDCLYAAINNAQFTPTEIREAAMLAQIRYENVHPRPMFFMKDVPVSLREDIAKDDWWLQNQ